MCKIFPCSYVSYLFLYLLCQTYKLTDKNYYRDDNSQRRLSLNCSNKHITLYTVKITIYFPYEQSIIVLTCSNQHRNHAHAAGYKFDDISVYIYFPLFANCHCLNWSVVPIIPPFCNYKQFSCKVCMLCTYQCHPHPQVQWSYTGDLNRMNSLVLNWG